MPPARPADPAEAERREHPGSFDPGTETGYLRRGPRGHELPLEAGSRPFDPGPGHYDERRARRAARQGDRPVPLAPVKHGGPSAPAPRLRREPSLRRPTAKVALALAAVSALALGAGALLGLPLPGIGSDAGAGQTRAALTGDAALLALSEGTPAGLTQGPYYPIAGEAGDGERAAKFGASRGGRKHEGQDLFAKPGTPLVAVRDGRVVDGGSLNHPYSGGRGNWVVIYSPLDERSYVYLHLLKPPLVRVGDEVHAGEPLGQLGCTGSCDGPHLHFEVRNGIASLRAETKAVDPLPLLNQWPQVPR